MSVAVKHCTCKDLDCPFNPVNHDKGCTLCIAKNLKLREVPSCFFNMVEDGKHEGAYTFEDFAKIVLESGGQNER